MKNSLPLRFFFCDFFCFWIDGFGSVKLETDNFNELCARKTCGNTVGERFRQLLIYLFSALSVKARDSPSTCCVETNIALLLACSNITVLATATTRTIHFFRFICRPERTGPIKCSIMCYFLSRGPPRCFSHTCTVYSSSWSTRQDLRSVTGCL